MVMARQSIIVLNSTGTDVTTVGQPIKAAGYYGSGKNLHTLAIYLRNFSGRIYMDATLASNPTEEDWFPINLNGYLPYLEYAFDNMAPLGEGGSTGVESLSFDGNFVYVRARMDRGTLLNPNTTNYGQIDRILINF